MGEAAKRTRAAKHRDPNASDELATRLMEDETLRFEASIFNRPMLPKNEVRLRLVFKAMCEELNDRLGVKDARHTLWMRSEVAGAGGKRFKESFFIDSSHYRCEPKPYAKSATEPQPSSFFRKTVVRVIGDGRYYPTRLHYVSPIEIYGNLFIIIPYIVSKIPAVEVIHRDYGGDSYEWVRRLRTDGRFPKEFIRSEPIIVERRETELLFADSESLDWGNLDAFFARIDGNPIAFESYHVISNLDHDGRRLFDHRTRAYLRLRQLSFQRDWGSSDDLQMKSRLSGNMDGLETLSHEYKNALDATAWNFLLADLRKSPELYETEEYRVRIEVALAQLEWPQNLATAVRAMSSMRGDSAGLRDRWLESGLNERFPSPDVVETYRRSICYLIEYLAGLSNFMSQLPGMIKKIARIRVVEATACEAFGLALDPAMIVELSRRASYPEAGPLNANMLEFPPFSRNTSDNFGPTFTLAAFVSEPARNAINHLRSHTIPNELDYLAWKVEAGDGYVRVVFLNAIAERFDLKSVEHQRSSDLMNILGTKLGVASVLPPKLGSDGSLAKYYLAEVHLHPQRLGLESDPSIEA